MGERVTGLAFQRLLPSTLLPPEDPSRPGRRTLRDWLVDFAAFALGLLGALTLGFSSVGSALHTLPAYQVALEWGLGALCCALLWWRRRWPVPLGFLTAACSLVSAACSVPAAIALFTVAVHRRTSAAVAVALADITAAAIFPIYRPQPEQWWIGIVITTVAVAAVVAWGMFVRARRQLVWTLRERAERAEAEQTLQAERARTAERTRIAREMHDVLGHRISLLALHAGALEMRPDLGADQVKQTAVLLRETAAAALEELRGVVGVLREDGDAAVAPQPGLADIPKLIEQTRQAGGKIDFDMSVADDAPGALGRDAYRIVQEGLTNVAKHARGTATAVRVAGAPGQGLLVTVRNHLPLSTAISLPGAGTGLLGLRERVDLAGGVLHHGTEASEFIVEAELPWP